MNSLECIVLEELFLPLLHSEKRKRVIEIAPLYE